MRPEIISGCSAIGFAIGGWAVPIAFPHVDPSVAQGMLWVAGGLVALAVALWAWGVRDSADKASSSVQTTTGHSSHAINAPNSTITINSSLGAVPTEALRPPMEISLRALEGLAGKTSPQPNMPLNGVIVRVYKALGGTPAEEHLKSAFYDKVDIEIADKVIQLYMAVWGRVGKRGLEEIQRQTLKKGHFEHKKGAFLIISDAVRPSIFLDLKFEKRHVDEAWPP